MKYASTGDNASNKSCPAIVDMTDMMGKKMLLKKLWILQKHQMKMTFWSTAGELRN